MSVAGVLLAAGSGTRYGGPKALAVSGDRTWLEIVIGTLRESGCRPVVAVLGAGAAAAQAGVRMDRLPRDTDDPPPPVLWVVNESWQLGRAGSLQCGLRAVPDDTTGAVIHSVDHPDVRAATIRSLVQAHLASFNPPARGAPPAGRVSAGAQASPVAPPAAGLIFLPTYRGRHGHPVLLSRAVWPEVFALAPDEPLRSLVHRDPARIRDVEVDDAGILRNRNEREPEGPAGSPAAGSEKGDP